jgi:hypothetical protein
MSIMAPKGAAAQAFIKMGGKITPLRRGIDPFTRIEKVFKSMAHIRAQTPEQATQLTLKICSECLGYPCSTVYHAELFKD